MTRFISFSRISRQPVTASVSVPDRHVLAMVFEHAHGQDDGPMAVNGRANLMRQHQFVTHEAPGDVRRSYCSRLPLSASNRWTASKFGESSMVSPG